MIWDYAFVPKSWNRILVDGQTETYNPSHIVYFGVHVFIFAFCEFWHCHPYMFLYKLVNYVVNINMTSVHTDQENFNSSNRSFDSTAVIAALATVVIVLLAVMIISIMFYFCFKKKKVKGTDMTR